MAKAQNATNISLVPTDDKLLVTYDLIGKKSYTYQVDLSFKKEDGSFIKPKSIAGDVGKKVMPGKGKTIIWQVYKDVDELKGNIEPIINIKEEKAPAAKAPEKIKIPKKQRPKDTQKQPNYLPFTRKKRRTVKPGWKFAFGPSGVDPSKDKALYDNKNGWQLGPTLRIYAGKKFYFQPELLYTRQSYKKALSNNVGGTYHNHYIRPQLLLGVTPFRGGIYFNAGMYYGHLFSAYEIQNGPTGKETTNYDNLPEMNGEDFPLNRKDIGYLLGGSLDMGRGAFVLGILYSSGLDNINNTDYWKGHKEQEGLELFNHFLQFYVQIGL